MQVARLKPSFDQHIEDPHFFETGRVIAGRYRIRRPLGRGGMGSVYLAEDLVLGESGVAIKVLRRGHSEDPAAINRFIREVRLTHKIQNQNVVRTFDFGRDGDSVFYTMEYLPGQSLEVLISTGGGLPCHTIIEMARQLMSGLSAVHGVGVVHRDLKPANIIVGSDGVLKITDFGIARASAAPATMFASDVFGTLRYVAPEVLLGEAAGPAVDFYALGVVLFELLTGTTPLSEENPARLILSKIEQAARPVSEYRADIPDWLVAGVDGLLERDPSLRMAAVDVFSAALFGATSTSKGSAEPSVLGKAIPLFDRAKGGLLSWFSGAYLRPRAAVIATGLICALFVLPISRTEIFSRFEVGFTEALFRARGPIDPDPSVVVVSMDEQSYQRLGVPLTSPWPRALHARLLNALADAGAKRVVFDIIFAEADRDNGDDRALAEAMRRVPTVLGAALGVSQRATMNGAFLLEELLHPAEMFEAESVGVGVVGLAQDLGRVRAFPKAVSEVFPTISTLSETSVALDRSDTSSPLDGSLINFYGPGRSIPTIPYELVIANDRSELSNARFAGKVVFVGLGLRSSTGASQRDAFITPFDQQTFGAELHATAASNLLQQSWIRQPSQLVRDLTNFSSAMIFLTLLLSLGGMALFGSLIGVALILSLSQFVLFLSGWIVPFEVGAIWGLFIGGLIKLSLVSHPLRITRRER